MTATQAAVGNAERYLAAVHDILEPVRRAGPEIELGRQLPSHVVQLMRDAGVFAVAVPRSWGGQELDPISQAQGIELLAAADASVGWCAMIGCDTGYVSAFLDDAVGRALFKDPTQAAVFVVNPTGVATPVAGGYSVTGRWSFASGATHAKVYALGCLAMTDAGPRMATADRPEVRVVVISAEQAEVVDTWTTTGVRGSGSHDVTVTGVFVADDHTFPFFGVEPKRPGPLYALSTMFTAKMGGVPLGIARGAIDDVLAMAATKRTMGNLTPIAEQPWLQTAVAVAETKLMQARGFYYDALREVWASLVVGAKPSLKSRAYLHLSIIGAVERAVEVVDAMYRAGGSASLYARGTLDRRLRDIHTIAQHVVFGPGPLADSGKVMLGLPAPNSLLLQD
jgi:indole-3-acetate monooxygenase